MTPDVINSREAIVAAWLALHGDETLRLDYPLDEKSVVFDVGGYRGDWAASIFELYGCTVHVFEPVKSYVAVLQSRFVGNPRIHVHPFGLAGTNMEKEFAVLGDASSAFRKGGISETVKLVRAADFLRQENIVGVNLMKANIEGGEYDLLEHLTASGLIEKFGAIQVQFHDFFDNAAVRREDIRKSLRQTHFLTYNFDFVWESWQRLPVLTDLEGAKGEVGALAYQIERDGERLLAVGVEGAKLCSECDETNLRLERCQMELRACRQSFSFRLGRLLLAPAYWIKATLKPVGSKKV